MGRHVLSKEDRLNVVQTSLRLEHKTALEDLAKKARVTSAEYIRRLLLRHLREAALEVEQ